MYSVFVLTYLLSSVCINILTPEWIKQSDQFSSLETNDDPTLHVPESDEDQFSGIYLLADLIYLKCLSYVWGFYIFVISGYFWEKL